MVGQNEPDDILVSELKAKEITITGSSVLLFLFQWENKNVDLITMGSLSFDMQIKILSDLLCPTILILPHPPYKILNRVILQCPALKRIMLALYQLIRATGPLTT